MGTLVEFIFEPSLNDPQFQDVKMTGRRGYLVYVEKVSGVMIGTVLLIEPVNTRRSSFTVFNVLLSSLRGIGG